MPLKAVLIDRNRLIAHGNWNEPLQELLLGLYRYNVSVYDLSNSDMAEMKTEDCLVIADCEETIQQVKAWNVAVLGYEPPKGHLIDTSLPMLVEGFEEIDFYFLERVYQRFHHLPWTVIETKRCFLREITLEDLDELYVIYEPEEITRYMDSLYEDRRKEEEYTKAYIENMYQFYGYGMWVVIEKHHGQLIGRAGINHLDLDGEVYPELGYMIALPYQKKGYATEVCRGILAYIKEATEFSKVYCLIEEKNEISIHLAEKLGFYFEKSVICNGKEMQRYVKILQT